ncbi:hypothetical protein VR010_00815 [Actinomycetaceae bacterium L2_0104]
MLRILFFIGAGFTAGGIIALVVGPPGAGAWALPVGMTLTVASGVLLSISRSMRGLQSRQPAIIDAARSKGRLGIARIDVLNQTGTLINDQPLCDIEITVRPLSGAPYRTVVRKIVPFVRIPDFQPGARHVVALPSEGQPDALFTDDDPDDPRWAHQTVPPVSSAGELQRPESGALRADGTRRRPLLGIGKKGRPPRILLYIVAFLAAGAAVLYLYRVAVQQTLSSISEGRLHADLREPQHLGPALQAVESKTGHGNIVNAYVSRDFIIVDAPVSAGAKETDTWTYRRGVVTHDGPATIQPRSEKEQFAIADVSWEALEPSAERAQERLGITDDDVSFHVRREPDADVESEYFGQLVGPVFVTFSLHGDYEATYLQMNADGSALQPSGGW